MIVKPFKCCKEVGRTAFISMQGLASPERTTEHRQEVKRSGTPAMCIKVNKVLKARRINRQMAPSPPRGSVIGCVLSRGSVLRTSPPACVLSCLRHFQWTPIIFFTDFPNESDFYLCSSGKSVVFLCFVGEERKFLLNLQTEINGNHSANNLFESPTARTFSSAQPNLTNQNKSYKYYFEDY